MSRAEVDATSSADTSRAQPRELLDRVNGEHWAGRLYMRRISPYLTRALARTSVAPNAVTGIMACCGVAAGAVLVISGLAAAVGAFLLVQLYLLLDCSDGELARLTGRTSITGVYLDRVGHYLTDAALLAGLGIRAAERTPDGWMVLGVAAALAAVLGKAETDLVEVARAQSGKPPVTDAAVQPRDPRVGALRRAASLLRVHRIIQSVELSILVVGAAVYDELYGGITATRVLVAACAAVAGLLVVAHLASILASSRLR
jgi:phosphatidylglycerophosphate synthase